MACGLFPYSLLSFASRKAGIRFAPCENVAPLRATSGTARPAPRGESPEAAALLGGIRRAPPKVVHVRSFDEIKLRFDENAQLVGVADHLRTVLGVLAGLGARSLYFYERLGVLRGQRLGD